MPDDSHIFAPRLPPANVAAEQAFLGALLSNNKTLDRAPLLRPEHFADPVNGKIFRRAVQRIEAGHVADAVTLRTDFENTNMLDEVGGTAYLASLLAATVGIINAGDYARVIRDCWIRRELIDVGESLVNRAFGEDPEADAQKLVDEAASAVMALGEQTVITQGADFATIAAAAPRRAEAAYKGDPGSRCLTTGLQSVDDLWGGLWPGQLYYLMARSRTGKSPFMFQIARKVASALATEAAATGEPVGHVHVFSLEMTKEDVININLAATTNWTAEQIRAGRIDDWNGLQAASDALAGLPIFIDDQADMDLPALLMRARATARPRRTRLILIDYRELVRRGREHARMQLPEWIPFLGYALKGLAKTLNVPVVALAQINKTRSGDGPTRPTLDDLPYDGGQAADAVFALHRPELYMPDDPPSLGSVKSEEQAMRVKDQWYRDREAARGVAEFLALKRRFGPTGLTKLRFNGPRMRFDEVQGSL